MCVIYISIYTLPNGTTDDILVPSKRACPIEEVKECACARVRSAIKVQYVAERNKRESTIR
jgi:hypothetical protein